MPEVFFYAENWSAAFAAKEPKPSLAKILADRLPRR